MFILGTKVHNITLSQALNKAESFLTGRGQHYIVTPNPEIVLLAKRNSRYRQILNKADLSLPDGIGLLFASRILCGRKGALKARVTGVDFMREFLPRAERAGCRVLLVGGQGGAAKKSAQNLRRKFKGITFFALEKTSSPHVDFLINEIIRPDCVFIALGAPKQEQWIQKNLRKYPALKLAMGVGGAFDFFSGHVRRAPFFLREGGFEWLWRLAMQPRRARRTFNAAVIFPILVIHSCLNRAHRS